MEQEIKCPICKGRRFALMGHYTYKMLVMDDMVERDSVQAVCLNCGQVQGFVLREEGTEIQVAHARLVIGGKYEGNY